MQKSKRQEMFEVSEGLTRWLYPELWWECAQTGHKKKEQECFES